MIRILFLLLFCYSSLYAGTIDPNVPDSKYIQNASSLDYVVEIEGKCQDNSLFYGSAVLIDDHNFITAAHVVENYKSCKISINRNAFVVARVISHPDFKHEKVGFADIAIGYSNKSFKLKTYPSLYNDNQEQNKICVIAGYGMTGKFNTENKLLVFDRKKRAGSNVVDDIENDTLICVQTNRGENNYTNMEFMIASGDSGGPLFIDDKLAGINSVLTVVKSELEERNRVESAHTRISKFVKWIQENKLVRK